jgi:hypothetical protein
VTRFGVKQPFRHLLVTQSMSHACSHDLLAWLHTIPQVTEKAVRSKTQPESEAHPRYKSLLLNTVKIVLM